MKIAIAGYGTEGKSNYSYFSRQADDITIVDERPQLADLPAGVKTILGPGAFAKLDDFDLVVRSAGVAPYKISTNGKIWSGTNEFFAKSPAPIIGITGSKGKGTTSSLIASILRAAGKTVYLVGNIGIPALDKLAEITPNDIVVYEMSSFQLWDIKRSPRVAVVLMIEPDHLNVHKDMADYVGAKAHITAYQTKGDTLVYNDANSYAQSIAAKSPAGTKRPYQSKASAHVQDGWFWYGEQKICSADTLQLAGAHNQDNACAAIDAAWVYCQDAEAITIGLGDFTGLPHRLKLVKTVDGVDYYDDSIATTPGSAIAALKAFDAPKVLILGGSSKGADFHALAEVATQHNLKMALTIGVEGDTIADIFEQHHLPVERLGKAISMSDIVKKAQSVSSPGDIVIISPACASFDMFKNYQDRGQQFIEAVESLA